MNWFLAGAFAMMTGLGFVAGCIYTDGRTKHDIAAHFYAQCRENLGLFERMTTLQAGQSACAQRITEELGIENRWPEELR